MYNLIFIFLIPAKVNMVVVNVQISYQFNQSFESWKKKFVTDTVIKKAAYLNGFSPIDFVTKRIKVRRSHDAGFTYTSLVMAFRHKRKLKHPVRPFVH